ncbi:cysteine-rich receptor-like protein kinase 8 [Tanacetum coccineum]
MGVMNDPSWWASPSKVASHFGTSGLVVAAAIGVTHPIDKGTELMKDKVSQEHVCEEEVPLNKNIGKQSGDLVEMPSEVVEQGMDDYVPDEIDGAKCEQLPNHVVKKGVSSGMNDAVMNPEDGDLIEDPSIYRAIVGKLLYLTITRLDIFYAAQALSQFSQAPKTTHLKALVKVLRYIKNRPVSRSSTEVEYRALADTNYELTWLKCLHKDLGVHISSPIPIFCDNASAIALASNPVQHARTKHIEIDCHFVRDKIKAGEVLPKFIPTKDQVVDVLTKGLSKAPHYYFLSKFAFDPYPFQNCEREKGAPSG